MNDLQGDDQCQKGINNQPAQLFLISHSARSGFQKCVDILDALIHTNDWLSVDSRFVALTGREAACAIWHKFPGNISGYINGSFQLERGGCKIGHFYQKILGQMQKEWCRINGQKKSQKATNPIPPITR